MTPIARHLSPFAVRFGHRFGLAHHGKAWSGHSDLAFGPAGRFSTRFRPRGWCAKLTQKSGHHATHLSRSGRTLCAFPGTQQCHAERLSKQQLIAGTGHQPTPAFNLLRGAQVLLGPEQVLRCRKR
jgi:hypothetical protein